MANRIQVSVKNAIITLYSQGWPKLRIARELGVDVKTVRSHVRELEDSVRTVTAGISNSLEVPAGKGGSKSPQVPTGKTDSRSQCAVYDGQVKLGLEQGLSAQRIWQDLVYEQGFEGAYDSVKRYVRKEKAKTPRRIWRMETLPGEEAQVDFGTGAWLRGPEGRKRRSWIFRIVLSCSRKAYSEAVLRQDTETFIRCVENAFRRFGGVTQTLCIDNLRAAVSKADWYEPQLNPKIESFCKHYGTVILPCRAGKPEHKGKVENSVKYVKNNALRGREFDSLAGENKHLLWWEETVADCRIHGTIRQQIRKRFIEVEKPALLSLPPSLFPCFQEGQRSVHRDGYIEVASAYYEVPPEYIGRQVWARWDNRTVRVFNRDFEQIALLPRQQAGQFSSTLGARGRRCTNVQRDMTWYLQRSAKLGPNCGLWAVEVMAAKDQRGIRVVQGLLALRKRYAQRQIDKACELALSHGAFHLRDIKRLLERPQAQKSFEFMDEHPLIRDMQEYSQFLEMLYPENQPIQEAAG